MMTQSVLLLFIFLTDIGQSGAEFPTQENATVRDTNVSRYGIPGRDRYYREWRRGDPSVNKNMWNSKKPLGKAELYIYLALLIGFATVVVGCWLSDNCWSPEPEHLIMIA